MNLESGYIVLLVRRHALELNVVRSQLADMMNNFPKTRFAGVKIQVFRYDDMPHDFAMLAEHWMLWMDTFDRNKAIAFYRGHVRSDFGDFVQLHMPQPL